MLRLMLYDRTDSRLSPTWWAGARLYRALGRLDAWHGAATWDEGLSWLAEVGGGAKIAEIQYWGHGTSGAVLMNRVALGVEALAGGPHLERLRAIRGRMAGPGALWWFRTCSTFQGERGHAFARAWTRFFGCRAAGHTRIIGPIQGGLQVLEAGAEPGWDVAEGLEKGWLPQWASWTPGAITMLHGRVD